MGFLGVLISRNGVKYTQAKARSVRSLVLCILAEREDWQSVRFASSLTATADAERRSCGKRATDCTERGACTERGVHVILV